MDWKTIGRFAALFVSVAVATELAYQDWRRRKHRDAVSSVRRRRQSIHDVIMLKPHENGNSVARSKHFRSPQLDRVISHLESSRHTLDCAIYVMTSCDLSAALIRLINCGVVVRCIVDADMAHASGSQVRRLEKAGAQVRWKKSTNLMHHKFCLIDANNKDENITPKLLTGSMNWTNQAMNGNWENVLVTTQETLVESYSVEFEQMWDEFKVTLDVLSSVPEFVITQN